MTQEMLASRVRDIVRGTVHREGAASTDPLADGGLDSVAMVRLLAALEEGLGISIPAEEIRPENFASVDDLVRMAVRLRGASGTP
jgi:acyl carrier protein